MGDGRKEEEKKLSNSVFFHISWLSVGPLPSLLDSRASTFHFCVDFATASFSLYIPRGSRSAFRKVVLVTFPPGHQPNQASWMKPVTRTHEINVTRQAIQNASAFLFFLLSFSGWWSRMPGSSRRRRIGAKVAA